MMNLTSSSFQDKIPVKYTCFGQDISPELKWDSPPEETKSFALILDDPDAPFGTFNHWVIFNIPAETNKLNENLSKKAELPDGSLQGKNGMFKTGYSGPCPPPGKPHHYHFMLYALDTKLSSKSGISKKQLLDAMEGHILAQTELVGIYQK